MNRDDLDRVLRSAATAPDDRAPEMPFGFETRVLALSRRSGTRVDSAAELGRFVWRVGAVAAVVLTLASAGAYRQFKNEQWNSLSADEYAIADSAIQTELVR